MLRDWFTGSLSILKVPPLLPDPGREKVRVLSLLEGGLTAREAAERLGLSVSTVYRHVSTLRDLGLLSRDRDVGLVGRAVLTWWKLQDGGSEGEERAKALST